MKKRTKGLLFSILLAGLFGFVGCTSNFCTVQDTAATIMSKENYTEGETYGHYSVTGSNESTSSITTQVENTAKTNGYTTPSEEFYTFMETKITEYMQNMQNYAPDTYTIGQNSVTTSYLRAIATYAGNYNSSVAAADVDYTKNTLWNNYDAWLLEAQETLGYEYCPDSAYVALYKQTLNATVTSASSCITPTTDIYNGITLEGKSWGDAFGYGVIEGLLVYPVSWLIYTFTNAFGGVSSSGWTAVAAIFLVTLIVRGILILLTFRQTMAQQKMTSLKPELDKIQAKYPNSQTNQYEKQRMAQEQMALYKKNKINPIGSLIVMIVQFPIFIAVWGAMRGSAILMSGYIFGGQLELAATTGTAMMNWSGCWWGAWIIFLLMAASQFASMQLPNWIQKYKAKKNPLASGPKLQKNEAADQQGRTMKMMSWIMLIMVIFMGIQLPIAMSIYWFISALISALQTVIIQIIISKKNDKQKFAKYKSR
jgi:YidC/Oxa1 family membrane protein insertase